MINLKFWYSHTYNRVIEASADTGFFWVDDVFVTGVTRNAVSDKKINMYDWSKGGYGQLSVILFAKLKC